MPNEIRPCTLWGETFDVMDVLSVWYHHALGGDTHFTAITLRDLKKGKYAQRQILSPSFDSKAKGMMTTKEAITAIAEALNAPVLATKKVLAGLPQGSDFLAHKVGYSPIWQSAFYCPESQQWWSEDEPLDESYIIKSDGCPKTLQVLLMFTLKGVRIKEKETNND